MSLDATDTRTLVTLLRRLADAGGAMPSTPRAIWDALAGVVPRVAVELCWTRGDAILLTHRDDADWHGWHLPGGFVGCDESLGQACRRVARRELEVEAALTGVVGDFVWPDHPGGAVLSLLCVIRCDADPTVGQWFTDLPEPMVRHHAALVARLRRVQADPARTSW
jgi:ADP-ribose pyrophosphatase YjhB (NUDIX family)